MGWSPPTGQSPASLKLTRGSDCIAVDLLAQIMSRQQLLSKVNSVISLLVVVLYYESGSQVIRLYFRIFRQTLADPKEVLPISDALRPWQSGNLSCRSELPIFSTQLIPRCYFPKGVKIDSMGLVMHLKTHMPVVSTCALLTQQVYSHISGHVED